jgi:hypothetical protein
MGKSSCTRSTFGNAPLKRLEQTGRELVKEPFEINIVKRVMTGAAAA